jgi:alkanesulfonate monooxygenase SsuD/methylene tetrahydromethanopterin reductase-like flavin-dependent oxidoreductase (luciferase family)
MTSLKAGMFVKPTADVGRNLEIIQELDEIGVQSAWQTNNVLTPDPLTFFAAVATTTQHIQLGTSIMQIYPRHPAALVSQVQALEGIAPGRVRLGVGTSHRIRMEKNLGIPMGKPITYLREYFAVLRGLLWEGEVEFHGEYMNVSEHYPAGFIPPKTEISVSALSEKSYRVAGQIADAAISWVSPLAYLVQTALPALQDGATNSGRETPPLIMHIPVAMTTDRARALDVASGELASYGALPFYQKMFASAGVPASADHRTSPEAIDALTISGSPEHIRQQLESIIAEGIGEILTHPLAINDPDAERKELASILAD